MNPYTVEVRCHRQLRGPYTGGGALLRVVVPQLAEAHPDLLARWAAEVMALAPDLAALLPVPQQTLDRLASRADRTRAYALSRTLRLAHGVAEMLVQWAEALHPHGVTVTFREVDAADPTDREMVTVLASRCSGGPIQIVEVDYQATPEMDLAADPAQAYIDGDGTVTAPAAQHAYAQLSAAERAKRHEARAATLAASSEPGVELGALPYHIERGSAPIDAGGPAFVRAVEECHERGFFHAALDLAERGRSLFGTARPDEYWTLTAKAASCLSYLMRGEDALKLLGELRAGAVAAETHQSSCFMTAMVYLRLLPAGQPDERRPLEWINTAIAFADLHTDAQRRVFSGAFMRNARASVHMHRAEPATALTWVNQAIAMTDAAMEPHERWLERGVLRYNRAQILVALGDTDSALRDYDEMIRRDPEYGDYYLERGDVRRAAGLVTQAIADYDEAIRLALPLHEAHYNRADLRRELGDDPGALADLDRAVVLDPDHVDTRLNRADLLLSFGEVQRAGTDVAHALTLEPSNAHLLCAQAAVMAELGDAEGAYAGYTQALTITPGLSAAWANRAVLAYIAGRPWDAIDDLDHAIELTGDPGLLANRAVALQEVGQHQRALEDLDVAVAAAGEDNPDLFYRRGVSRYALGDHDGARADWAEHLSVYGDHPSPYTDMIQSHAADLVA